MICIQVDFENATYMYIDFSSSDTPKVQPMLNAFARLIDGIVKFDFIWDSLLSALSDAYTVQNSLSRFGDLTNLQSFCALFSSLPARSSLRSLKNSITLYCMT